MVAKKSAKANLENNKSFFILIGFVLVLSLLFIALEWSKTDVTKYVQTNFDTQFEQEVEVPQTAEKTPPPPPPPAPIPISQLKIVNNTVETEGVKIISETSEKEAIPISKSIPVTETEEPDVLFRIVESPPEFPGNVFKYLSENIHYPQSAIEYGIQGKVICEFTVNKDGSIVDVTVIRGVDQSLDKEALRVINSMPKWIPGKQRGKAVRVKFTLPVNFKLMM